MNVLVKRHLPLLHNKENLKELFPDNVSNIIHRRNKSFKE